MPAASRFVLAVSLVCGLATRASGQDVSATNGPVRPAPVVEVSGGWAGFIDESIDPIDHAVGGVGARVYLSRRISVGPELQYFIGPGHDRDVMATGNVTIDVLASSPGRRRRTTPFFVTGGGMFRHTNRYGGTRVSSTAVGIVLGVGVRTWVRQRVFIAADARLLRIAATVGIALR